MQQVLFQVGSFKAVAQKMFVNFLLIIPVNWMENIQRFRCTKPPTGQRSKAKAPLAGRPRLPEKDRQAKAINQLKRGKKWHWYYQRKFRNLTSDYTESCCWRSVNQEMWSRRCDIAEMWDIRIWRVGSARHAVFYHSFVAPPARKVRS